MITIFLLRFKVIILESNKCLKGKTDIIFINVRLKYIDFFGEICYTRSVTLFYNMEL